MAVQSRDQGRRKTEHLPELKTGIFQFFTGRFGNEQCGGDHENGNVVGHDVINSETVEPQLRAPWLNFFLRVHRPVLVQNITCADCGGNRIHPDLR